MSWALLLSQYPKSILKDKTSLVILAFLERGGFANESDVVRQLGSDTATLARHLLALHRNQLIEYGKNYIRLSERGRNFLDAFDLSEDIVEDVLTTLQLKDVEHASLKGMILGYRERAYPQYLRSLESMQSWDLTCKHFTWLPSERESSAKVGSLALWLRDLRNWLAHDVETALTYKDVWEPLRQMLSSTLADTRPALDHSGHAASWIRELDFLERNTEREALLKNLEPKIAVFCLFTHARSNLEVEAWLDEWRPQGRSLLVLDACKSGVQAVDKLMALHWLRSSPLLAASQQGSTLRQVPTDTPASLPADLLTKILTASSIEDLAAQSPLTRADLNVVLYRLSEKCKTLLHAQRKMSTDEEV